jgi:hypothetical protein
MEALGRLVNVLPVADDVYVSMETCSNVMFVGVLAAGDTWTLTSASDAAGTGAAVLATMTRWHVSATVGAAWTKKTQAAASTIVTSSSEDVMVVEIHESELPDDHTYVKLASTSTGTVVAIQTDLKVQRAPANLAALV